MKGVNSMAIRIEHLYHTYMQGSPFEKQALNDITLHIAQGEFIGLIGHTGSGKSTLIQHLNRLLKPTQGNIYILGKDITNKEVKIREIRSKVGLVFQYPEHQLFEETVYKDIAFGPLNAGVLERDVEQRVLNALKFVGLKEAVLEKSPFELSGGQKRRVAIAGVIAMKPEILILDEPTAGLDPAGRDEILFQIKSLHTKLKMTVILVSHSMEDVARIVDRIIVMHQGKIAVTGEPGEIFKRIEMLEKIGLSAPQITHVMRALKEKGWPVKDEIFTVQQAKNELLRLLEGKK